MDPAGPVMSPARRRPSGRDGDGGTVTYGDGVRPLTPGVVASQSAGIGGAAKAPEARIGARRPRDALLRPRRRLPGDGQRHSFPGCRGASPIAPGPCRGTSGDRDARGRPSLGARPGVSLAAAGQNKRQENEHFIMGENLQDLYRHLCQPARPIGVPCREPSQPSSAHISRGFPGVGENY